MVDTFLGLTNWGVNFEPIVGVSTSKLQRFMAYSEKKKERKKEDSQPYLNNMNAYPYNINGIPSESIDG